MWCRLADHQLKDLVCTRCNFHLSVAPISNTKDGFLCGRCRPDAEAGMRNTVYELLATNLEFPCKYRTRGCREWFPFNRMGAHEESCSKRPYLCPSVPVGGCLWRGCAGEVQKHFVEKHETDVLDSKSVQIDLNEPLETCKMFIEDSVCFFLDLQYDPNASLTVNLKQIGVDRFKRWDKYEITLRSSGSSNTLTLASRTISRYLTKNPQFSDPDPISKQILHFISPENVHLTISLTENCPQTDSNVLKVLECTVCTEYMRPPISQCETGHSFCSQCTKMLPSCPICKERMGRKRNYSLDALSEQIYLPCRNQMISGCTFAGMLPALRDHELGCVAFACPMMDCCDFVGNYGVLVEHCRSSHRFFTAEALNLVCALNTNRKVVCRLIVAYDAVFLSCRKFENNKLYWSILYVGPSERAEDYSFVIEFFAQRGKKMSFGDVCKVYSGQKMFVDCLILPYFQVQMYVTENIFMSNIKIHRNT